MSLNIKKMLLGLVGLLTVTLIGLAALALVELEAANHDTRELANNWLPSVDTINAINTNASDMRIAEGSHVMSVTTQDMAAAEAKFDAVLVELKGNQAKYEKLISSGEEERLYKDFRAKLAKYLSLHERLFTLSRNNQNAEASALFRGPMNASFDTLSATTRSLVKMNREGADKSRSDAQETVDQAKSILFTAAALGGLLSVAAIWTVLAKVISPLSNVTEAMKKISEGNLETQVSHTTEKNEIGLIASTLLVFREGLTEAKRLREETEALRVQAELVRRDAMLKLADDFEKSVGIVVSMVSSAATEMQAAATQLTATATETSHQSTAVSAAAEEAGTNVTSVASAAEELGASVGEIGRQVSSSATMSQKAVAEADKATSVISELNAMAASIGGVVDLIAGLASQTNLLALNATIESARAGEAGKGFAVVASEVKALAGQTTRATSEISDKITKIQETTALASENFQNVSETIRALSSTNSAIAAAVEQQSAATSEIVKAVAQASLGAQEVTANIAGVAQGTEQTGAAASQVLASSSELAQQSERLHHEMETFLANVRAA
ncbi:methyl-accepting chemotaxis protein [Asticcacaulis sp. DXS10W]|uniref:Methyl-accepting chemotaxis protein n=1 Tax=Asticcacaulis currens TaxID=2984210 RepID=A0ABT5IBB6_9CAUL|nr:methyl-accepting chemotaxis protein [Asticcacaulis currens]MDC7693485.1 methyl-accepting chemotaxis protein [Asticcacaulis currens]